MYYTRNLHFDDMRINSSVSVLFIFSTTQVLKLITLSLVRKCNTPEGFWCIM